MFAIYNHEGGLELHPKQSLWDWLKAERKWQDKARQWLRAEGVSEHVLKLRRRGIADPPLLTGRAARRRARKGFKRVAA